MGKIDTKKETTTTRPSAQQSGALQPMLTKRSITHNTGNISSLTYPLTAMNNDATIINRILVCLTKKSLEMYIATFDHLLLVFVGRCGRLLKGIVTTSFALFFFLLVSVIFKSGMESHNICDTPFIHPFSLFLWSLHVPYKTVFPTAKKPSLLPLEVSVILERSQVWELQKSSDLMLFLPLWNGLRNHSPIA